MKRSPPTSSKLARADSPRVLIAAGGTGGHVFPALAVAEELKSRGLSVTWLGTPNGLEAKWVPEAGIEFHVLAVRGLRGRGLLGLLTAPIVVLRALLGALRVVRSVRPNLVLGMGGYASGPTGVAARLSGVPLAIHEQNAIPGLTNRLLAPLAARVMEAFPGSFPASTGAIHTGNPLRRSFAERAPEESAHASGPTGDEGLVRILVLGGSQGALALNRVLPGAFARAAKTIHLAVWHQTGAAHQELTREAYSGCTFEARAEAFIEDMPAAYRWADLVICRAGAMTVAELAYTGVASVLVPFPHAVDDHQSANAAHLAASGAAVLLPQSELAPERCAGLISELLQAGGRLREMAQAARRLAVGDAAERVALHCVELADV